MTLQLRERQVASYSHILLTNNASHLKPLRTSVGVFSVVWSCLVLVLVFGFHPFFFLSIFYSNFVQRVFQCIFLGYINDSTMV